MNVEQKADKLEGLLKDNNVSEVSRLLQWEAQNKPEEYGNLLQKFQEKNNADLQKNGLLPKVELHDDGGFMGTGLGKHVNGFAVKDTFGNQVAHGQEVSKDAPKGWHPWHGTAPHGGQETVIYGVQAQQEVNTNSMLRAGANMWTANKRFESHINNGYDNNVHTYNNNTLQSGGFRSHMNGQ